MTNEGSKSVIAFSSNRVYEKIIESVHMIKDPSY